MGGGVNLRGRGLKVESSVPISLRLSSNKGIYNIGIIV